MSDNDSLFSLASQDVYHIPSPPIHNYALSADEEAIFGRGLVLEQSRSTLQAEPVARQPLNFESTIDQQFSSIRRNISDDAARRAFLEDSQHAPNRLITLVNAIEPGQRIKLSTIILPTMTKQYKSVKIANDDVIRIPIPKREFLDLVESAMEVYFQRLIDTATSMEQVIDDNIDIVSTAAYVRSFANNQASHISKTVERRKCLSAMLGALILERQVYSQFKRFKHLIATCNVSPDPMTQGAFVHLGTSSNLENRMRTYITKDVIRASPTCTYNFNVNQFRNLVLSVFSRIPLTRANAKVSLLSSVKETIRQEIATAPLKVLTHAIGEFYLTQHEALMFLFSFEKDVTSFCPLCARGVIIDDGRTEHSTCAYAQFVADLLCLKVGKGFMSTVSVVYLKPSIHEYTRRVLHKYHEHQASPIVHETPSEQIIYRVSNDMSTRVVSSMGTRSVRIDNPAVLRDVIEGSSSTVYDLESSQ